MFQVAEFFLCCLHQIICFYLRMIDRAIDFRHQPAGLDGEFVSLFGEVVSLCLEVIDYILSFTAEFLTGIGSFIGGKKYTHQGTNSGTG